MRKQIRREVDWVLVQEWLYAFEKFPMLFHDSEFKFLFSQLRDYVDKVLDVGEDYDDFYVVYEVEDKDEENGTA